jgi:hypothetical protein
LFESWVEIHLKEVLRSPVRVFHPVESTALARNASPAPEDDFFGAIIENFGREKFFLKCPGTCEKWRIQLRRIREESGMI